MIPGGAAPTPAAAVAEAVARQSYGRLLATVAARTRNLAAAEDALAEAFATALRVWPRTGLPDRPEAWLLTAARRVAGHAARHGKVQDAASLTIAMLHAEMQDRIAPPFPDDRLALLFTCAHPALEQGVRTALMLQTVLGLDAARIGAAFLVSGPTMGQRLVRAKTRIREAGIPFAAPAPEDLPGRLDAVLAAIHAAFGTGWDMIGGAVDDGTGLVAEALFLARLIVGLMPDAPESKGLLALMLYCEARRPARRAPDGAYVPLRDQDRALWLRAQVIEAESLLREAASLRRFGRFQAEAAIQSLHVVTRRGAAPDPRALAGLYDLLVAHHPAIGARVGQAVARAGLLGPTAGLALLDALPSDVVAGYQPYWAARLHLLTALGDVAGAAAARERAIDLAEDPAVRHWLLRA